MLKKLLPVVLALALSAPALAATAAKKAPAPAPKVEDKSASVKEAMEAKLGTTLINRTTRRMDLTEEGKFFFERAKAILQQMDELEERLSLHRQTPSGRLRINAASPFMLHAIVPYIPEFREL